MNRETNLKREAPKCETNLKRETPKCETPKRETNLKLKTIFWPPKIVSVLIPQIKTADPPVSSPLNPDCFSDNIPKDYYLEC